MIFSSMVVGPLSDLAAAVAHALEAHQLARRFLGVGKLTIKGTTSDVSVPVQLARVGASKMASGSFTVKRLDFRIAEGEWTDIREQPTRIRIRIRRRR